MALAVDSICTDTDLANQVGGLSELNRINKDQPTRDVFRQAALADAIAALASRAPPLHETDLANPVELKLAVCYRALSKIYFAAMAAQDDRNHTLARNYEREYLGAIHGRFTPASGGGGAVGGSTFPFERR
jgi:hypothetical protein